MEVEQDTPPPSLGLGETPSQAHAAVAADELPDDKLSKRRLEFEDGSEPGAKPRKKARQLDTRPQSSNTAAQLVGLTERQQLALLKRKTEEEAMVLNVHKRNASGEYPLHLACIKGNMDLAAKLLSNGARVDAKDNAGWTALHEACNYGYDDVTALLIENDANVNAKGGDDDTPLHDAAVNGHQGVVRLLLKAGANVNQANKRGDTPLSVAYDDEMQALLREYDGRQPSELPSKQARKPVKQGTATGLAAPTKAKEPRHPKPAKKEQAVTCSLVAASEETKPQPRKPAPRRVPAPAIPTPTFAEQLQARSRKPQARRPQGFERRKGASVVALPRPGVSQPPALAGQDVHAPPPSNKPAVASPVAARPRVGKSPPLKQVPAVRASPSAAPTARRPSSARPLKTRLTVLKKHRILGALKPRQLGPHVRASLSSAAREARLGQPKEPPAWASGNADLWKAQEQERVGLHLRQCFEVDRLHRVFDEDVRRSCNALLSQGAATATPAALEAEAALARSRHEEAAEDCLVRHRLECDALLGSQGLDWRLEVSAMLPVQAPPQPDLRVGWVSTA